MAKQLSTKSFLLSLGAAFGNYYYHHKHQLLINLNMEPMPVDPDINSDPPTSNFDPLLEERIDKAVNDIENYAVKKPSLEISDQIEYKGDFVKQKDKKIVPNGKGVYYSKNNQLKMVGTFKNGVIDGPALFRSPDGVVVKTEFKEGQINGPGVRYLGDMKFEGNLIDGKPKGNGVYTFGPNAKVFVREEDGVEKAKWYDGSGKLKYRGEFKEGQYDGYGELFLESGRRYQGDFKNGKLEGLGVLKDKYGDVIYRGVFSDDDIGKKWYLYTEPAIYGGLALSVLGRLIMK